jgi:hypothetical protein
MTPHEWLRAIEVWSPFIVIADPAHTKEECIEAIGDALARNFPPELFCEATVRVATRHCETFPNYYWCCRVLEGRL